MGVAYLVADSVMEVSEISFLRNRVVEVREREGTRLFEMSPYFMLQPEVFVLEGKSFLEKMRHTSCFDLVRKIKVFISTFTEMEGKHNPDQFSSKLQEFLDVSLLFTKSGAWSLLRGVVKLKWRREFICLKKIISFSSKILNAHFYVLVIL